MDNNLVRTDVVFGRRVNMVGNISADLVLESLGKIYIKSRNKSLTLEEVIRSLVTEDPNTSTSRCKIVEGIENLDTSEFKEGTFVFDKLSNILYLFIDDELLELINVAPEGTGFVKRSGDTMTGRLAIYVKNGPPLYVNSSDLVQNLNAQYLNGETADDFTRRNADEKIGGAWTFQGPTTFESGVMLYKDLITHGSIGTPSFSSGFGGYGWRMDADTNTLTVDNLVVRKLMLVYELVVNKISATNGSLWVTNAGKVTSVIKLQIKAPDFFNTGSFEYKKFAGGLQQGDAFIKTGTVTIRDFSEDDQDPNEPFMTASGTVVHVRLNCWTVQSLKDAKLIIISNNNTDFSLLVFDALLPTNYNEYPLFDEEFKFDCTFPIVTRDSYGDYKRQKEELIDIYNKILPLQGLSELSNSELEELNGYIRTRDRLEAATNPYSYIKYVLPYYKYFANGDYYLVGFDSDELPVFKPGDLLRCLKWTYNGIKYYDAIVCSQIDSQYVIQLADSILDKKTTITYNSSLEPETIEHKDDINSTLYETSERRSNPTEDPIGLVEEKDGLVLMGHLWNSQRLNAVYITSTDDGSPFMDVMSGINRPDFSVIYYTPIFLTIKLYAKAKGPRNFKENGLAIPSEKVEGIPGTLDYYVLNSPTTTSDYTYVKVVGDNSTDYYMIKGYHPNILSNDNGFTCTVLKYLNVAPDKNTSLILESDDSYLLLEDGGHLCLGPHPVNSAIVDEGFFLLESIADKLQLASTRTTRARFGNLDGILDEMFPLDKQPYGYGLYGQNVFLTGEFYLSNGKAVADIGNDAITFAIAGLQELGSSVDLLRRDTDAAYNLLKNNTYSKGLLRTAGMMISGDTNPGIVMWGNKIIIATTTDEFYGLAQPTALFAEGKIQAKFLEIHDAYSDVKYVYPAILNKYSRKMEENSRNWTFIEYSAKSGEADLSNNIAGVRDVDSPSLTGGVKIYTDSSGNTKYVRNFHIVRFLNNISDYDMRNHTWPEATLTNYDAWIEVELDGDIPDIADIHYVTFEIGENLYDGTSLENLANPSVFDLDPEEVDEVLKDVTLWSLRSDGTGNLGGKSMYWDSDGNVQIDSELRSQRGSIGDLEYYKGDVYFNILLSNNAYIEAEHPKMLLHDGRLKSTLLLVSYKEEPIANLSNYYLLTLAAHSVLESDSLYIRKGYSENCVQLTPSKGLTYEIENKATMGVSYPLLNLLIVPYETESGLRFYVRCNYIPQISGVSVYYQREGLYYFVINCSSSAFGLFLNDSFRQGNINILATGVNKMFGGLGYFDNGEHQITANIGALNLCDLAIGNSNNTISVGGDDSWWNAEVTRTLLNTSGITAENGYNNGLSTVKSKLMNGILTKIGSSIIAIKIEVSNNSGRTEGGVLLGIYYDYFLDDNIPTMAVMNAGSYDLYLLLDWIKLPYTSTYTEFSNRYNEIIGTPDPNTISVSGTLGFYIYYMNLIMNNNTKISVENIPGSMSLPGYDSEGAYLLSILNYIFNDSVNGITIDTIKNPTGINNYIDSLTDNNSSQSSLQITFSGYVRSVTGEIYSVLSNDGVPDSLYSTASGLAASDDYNRDVTLQGLVPVIDIKPSLSSFKVPNLTSTTLYEIAESLRAFVERECNCMEKFLTFLEKLLYNIKNSKVPDILITPVAFNISPSPNTLKFKMTVKNDVAWTITNNAQWCYGGITNGQGGLTTSGTGDGTQLSGEIRVNGNSTYETRSTVVTASGGDTSIDLTIVQASKQYEDEGTISISPTTIVPGKNGGTYQIKITCSDEWEITGIPNWISLSVSSGTGDATITATVSSNSSSSRSTSLSITSGRTTKTVSIQQSGDGSSSGGEESGGSTTTDVRYRYNPNASYGYDVNSTAIEADIILLGSSLTLSGNKLYSVGLISDIHSSLENDEGNKNGEFFDEDDLINVLKIFRDDSGETGTKFIVSCGDVAECWPYSDSTPSYDNTFPLKDDSLIFKSIFNQYAYSNGLRIFNPLGNHDHLGLKTSVAGGLASSNRYNFGTTDSCDSSRTNETTDLGYNSAIKDRIDNIWIPNTQLNDIDSNSRDTSTLHYFRFNGLPSNYTSSDYESLKDNLSGYNSTSRGILNSYSKLNYWFQKTDGQGSGEVYIILSADYGDDLYNEDGLSSSVRMLSARKIIDTSSTAQANDPYIKRMVEYVTGYGYNSANEAKYNYQLYHPNTLIWLKEIIENKYDAKIFVFSHHFMPNRVGSSGRIDSSSTTGINTGLPSQGAWAYQSIEPAALNWSEASANDGAAVYKKNDSNQKWMNKGASTLCGIEFWFVNRLMTEHKNVIWFSGHSHISWKVTENGVTSALRLENHITNNDYDIVAPTGTSSDNKNAIYTKSSNTPKTVSGTDNRGYFVSLPSLSKPRTINLDGSGYTLLDAWTEFAFMDVYSNGIKLRGYNLTRTPSGDSVWTNEGSSGGSSEESQSVGDDVSGVTPLSNSNVIKFKLTHNLKDTNNNPINEDIRLSGLLILNVSKDPTDWTNSTQVNAHMHAAIDGHFPYNDIIIHPGESYITGEISEITNYYPEDAGTDFTDGTWYIMSVENGPYGHPVFLYSREYSRSRQAVSGSLHMYWAELLPAPTKLLRGYLYNLNITNMNDKAMLAPTSTFTATDFMTNYTNYGYAILYPNTTDLA